MCCETWLGVDGFPDYEVSDKGHVKSLKYGWPRVLKPIERPRGYLSVTLYNSNYIVRQISWLVLEAFVGKRPDGYVTNHKDGIKINNELANLEWVTVSYNTKHAFDIGLRVPVIRLGEENFHAKLTGNQVLLIKEMLYHCTYPKSHIAEMFNVSPRCIQHIDKGNSWTHIKYP